MYTESETRLNGKKVGLLGEITSSRQSSMYIEIEGSLKVVFSPDIYEQQRLLHVSKSEVTTVHVQLHHRGRLRMGQGNRLKLGFLVSPPSQVPSYPMNSENSLPVKGACIGTCVPR